MPRVSSRIGFEQIPCTEMSHFVIRSCSPGAPARLCRRSGFPAMNKAWCTAVALAGLVSVFGCGGDEGTTPGGLVTAGFGGVGGAAGFGGTSATSGTGAPAPIACGTATCSSPAIPGGVMLPGIMIRPSCCANMATGTCGSLNGTVCEAPPPPAPLCPAPPAFGGFMLKACCVAATQICGIDGSMAGLGCTSLGAMFGGGGAQTRCDGTPVPPPPAAGAPAVAGAPATTAGTGGVGTVGGAGGASGGAGGSTATSGTGGSTTTAGAGGATAGAGGARAGTGGATAGAGGRGF
jgi:hypothetical protein